MKRWRVTPASTSTCSGHRSCSDPTRSAARTCAWDHWHRWRADWPAMRAPVPRLPVQFVHEDDVGQALSLCVVGAGPAGAYNIAGDGVLTGTEVARERGLAPLPGPGRLVHGPARAVAALGALPLVPPATAWAEVLSHPAIMDTTKAKRELGWKPRYTGLDALRDTLRRWRAGRA